MNIVFILWLQLWVCTFLNTYYNSLILIFHCTSDFISLHFWCPFLVNVRIYKNTLHALIGHLSNFNAKCLNILVFGKAQKLIQFRITKLKYRNDTTWKKFCHRFKNMEWIEIEWSICIYKLIEFDRNNKGTNYITDPWQFQRELQKLHP